MKYCPYCGASITDYSMSFCSECGKPVKSAGAPSEEKRQMPGSVPASKPRKALPLNKKAPPRSKPLQQTRRDPRTQGRKQPAKRPAPPARPNPDNRMSHAPAKNPMDENYDGYYDDVPTADNGRTEERFEPELIKRIIFIAAGALVIVILSVVLMSLL